MYQITPALERAVAAARSWADRCGSESVQLHHYVLGLIEEEEGRAARVFELLGISLTQLRQQLVDQAPCPAPPLNTLYEATRVWTLAHRDGVELLSDAFLLAVVRADEHFQQIATTLGFAPAKLEKILKPTRENPAPKGPSVQGPSVHDDVTRSQPSAESSLSASPQAIETTSAFDQSLSIDQSPGRTITTPIDTARVIDANLNRAREAARVVEDYCRFVLEDAYLTQLLKTLRHSIAAAGATWAISDLLAARETQADVGTQISTTDEYQRQSPHHVAMANIKRLQESLRTLEEFSKIFDHKQAQRFEALRYQTYTVERALAFDSRRSLADARLYLLLTQSQCQAAPEWTLRQAAAGGVDLVQIREKHMNDRELLAWAKVVRQITRELGKLLIINDRCDIALLAEADGVHIGQEDLSVKDARRIVGPRRLIGVSTHSLEQLRQAVVDGADYVGIGPVFPSPTKPFESFPGLEFVRAATRESSLPAFALGGLSVSNIGEVIAAGAIRVAVSSAICQSPDPQSIARQLKQALPGMGGL
ncbi:MAG: thiamine phosphate synthase [Gemmataceae bacterium]|nr:thiamine phosphate synthase [Gemmata sp.]MDW8197525.1 thiamine phosphate synthase [Gemmataceae bacterium]